MSEIIPCAPLLIKVTKGMSENMVDSVHRAADKVIHPVSAAAHGQYALSPERPNGEEDEREDFDSDGNRIKGFADSTVPTLEEKTIYERRPSTSHANGAPLFDLIEEGEVGGDGNSPDEATVPREVKKQQTVVDGDSNASKRGVPVIRGSPDEKHDEMFGAPANATHNDDQVPNKDTERNEQSAENQAAVKARQTLRKHLSAKVGTNAWSMPTPTPKINPNRFHDPLDDRFWKDMWVAVAVHNTEIYRKVFRCVPDDLVTTWAAYKAFANHAEKFNRAPEHVAKGGDEPPKVVHGGPGTHGAGGGGSGGGAVGQGQEKSSSPKNEKGSGTTDKLKDGVSGMGAPSVNPETASKGEGKHSREPSGPNDPWAQWERDEMEDLLNEVRGHLGEPSSFLPGFC